MTADTPMSEVRKQLTKSFRELLEREQTKARMDPGQYMLIALTLREVDPDLAFRFLALAGAGMLAREF